MTIDSKLQKLAQSFSALSVLLLLCGVCVVAQHSESEMIVDDSEVNDSVPVCESQ